MKPKFKTPTLVSPPSQTIELTSERQSKSVLAHTNCTSRAEKDGRDLEDWLQAESETAQANLEIVVASKALLQRGISRAGMASRTRLKEGNRAFWPYVALAISIIGPG
jgi:hypothetical protein